MRILLQTFNSGVNSKSGTPLPPGQVRGTPDWREWETLLIDCLKELGHETSEYLEHPVADLSHLPGDVRMYVHQTKRDKPDGDFFYMQMHLRDLFTLDREGWGADHSQAESTDAWTLEDETEAERYCMTLAEEFHSTGLSKCDQPSQTPLTPARFILVPVQIPRDYTIHHHSPVTVKYFIDSIQAWAIETQNHVVFKMHPFNKGDADLHRSVDDACVSPYIHKAEGNIHELIRRSVGLFVINSGTGFEALIHGRPVATFGNCDYRRATFNADLRRLDEVRNFLYSYTDDQRRMGYKFAAWYCLKHGYRLGEEGTRGRLLAYLRENI